MPDFDSGRMTWSMVRHQPAPASFAASIRRRSMRIMVLKIGTTMNSVYRCV